MGKTRHLKPGHLTESSLTDEKPGPARRDYDPYTERFLNSPVYVMVMNKTIKSAATAYEYARYMSVASFAVGIVLLSVAVFFAFRRDAELLAGIFAGAGTVSIVSLLLYRPIERIQAGVNELIKSQIASLSFMAQYDAVGNHLASIAQPTSSRDRDREKDEVLELARYLQEAASRMIADLDKTPMSKSAED